MCDPPVNTTFRPVALHCGIREPQFRIVDCMDPEKLLPNKGTPCPVLLNPIENCVKEQSRETSFISVPSNNIHPLRLRSYSSFPATLLSVDWGTFQGRSNRIPHHKFLPAEAPLTKRCCSFPLTILARSSESAGYSRPRELTYFAGKENSSRNDRTH